MQRKKYNNKAFVEMHGYDTYDIEWRQYYPGIMKFQTPDPEIEDVYSESPYSMCDNNMENRTDPDGRFWNYVIGAVVGGGLDYVSQVAVNLAEGHSVQESLTHVSMKSIAVSAIAGATGVGIASLADKAATIYHLGKVSTKIVQTAAGIASDATTSAGSQYAKTGKISGKDVLVDMAAGQAGRSVAGKIMSKVNNPQKAASLQKQASRAEAKATHNPSQAKTTRAQNARNASHNYNARNSKISTTTSSVTSNSISNTNNTINEYEKTKKRPQISYLKKIP